MTQGAAAAQKKTGTAASAGSAGTPLGRAALFLAFACFFATLPMYSPNIVALNAAGVPEVTAWFSQGVLGFSIAAALLGVLGLRWDAARGHVRDVLTGPVALGSYFVGGAGYAALVALGPEVSEGWVDALGLACAALAGLPFVAVCVRWAELVRTLSLPRLAALCGLGIAAAALLNIVVARLAAPASFILHVCMLAVGTFAVLASERDNAPAPNSRTPIDLRSFASVMGTPLVGIGLSSFVIGIMPTTVFGGAVDTQAVGAIAAGVVTAAGLLVMRLTGAPASAFVQRFLFPVAAAAAIGTCALPGMEKDLQVAVCYTLFSVVGAMALAIGCGISNAREFPRPFVFASIVGTYCLTGVLGLAAGSALSDITSYQAEVVVALAAAYGVLAVGIACAHSLRPADTAPDSLLGAQGTGTENGQPQNAPGDAPTLERSAELLAERFGLTQRETEIVRILARGHGCTFVAETLLISKSTVYTHVRNIYRKLDISNHDQLIQALDRQH